MEWFSILALVLFGLALIIVEIIFVPGTTFVGILGLVIAGFGIWQSFISFGTEVGLGVLLSSSAFAIAAIVYSFKSGIWKRFALNDSHKSRFNEDVQHNLEVGDIGETISVLRPIGKAEFNERTFEVRTNGSYLESGISVKVIRIRDHTLFVEPVGENKEKSEAEHVS